MGYVKWHSINVFLESCNSFLLFWAQLDQTGNSNLLKKKNQKEKHTADILKTTTRI